MTVLELLYDAFSLIDEYNDDGVVISAEDNADLITNGIRFVDMAAKEIYQYTKTFNEYNLVLKTIPNLLGSQFDIREFIGDDLNYPEQGIKGAKAYFFTVDSDATVYVEEYNGTAWDVIDTINAVVTEETDFSGLITPTDSNYPVRLRFSGNTFYRHLNRCLYSYPFKADYIPEYRAYKRYEMPADYGELDKIVTENGEIQYDLKSSYKWEGFNTLAVRYDYEGTLKIIYSTKPVTYSATTDTIAMNNPLALQFIRFFVAAKLATTENTDLVNFYEQKANEIKYEAQTRKPSGEEGIQDIYFDNTPNSYYGGYYGNIYR